jgi:hypothetical protein
VRVFTLVAVFLLAPLTDTLGQEQRSTTFGGSRALSLVTETALVVKVAGSEVGSNPVSANLGLSYRMDSRVGIGDGPRPSRGARGELSEPDNGPVYWPLDALLLPSRDPCRAFVALIDRREE